MGGTMKHEQKRVLLFFGEINNLLVEVMKTHIYDTSHCQMYVACLLLLFLSLKPVAGEDESVVNPNNSIPFSAT